jgi:very-short-patch-repair endonuclease
VGALRAGVGALRPSPRATSPSRSPRGPAITRRVTSTRGLRERARELRRAQTPAEQHLWRRLRARQVSAHRFRRQQPLGRYIVDFVTLEARLVVEVDGDGHAATVARDRERDAWLASEGFRVLRFSNREVLTETEAVLERIFQAIGEYWNPGTTGEPEADPYPAEGPHPEGDPHPRPPP